jgi:hypothetical protein
MASANTLDQIGLYRGDYIIIQGASIARHNGLHRILTVTGSGGTSFTFQTDATTAASTGTITVRRAELWNISGNYTEGDS